MDGVSGARPGSRRPGQRLNPGQLGRWVENKLDWLLDDDEDWREPWQETKPQQEAKSQPRSDDFRPEPRAEIRPRRRPLEAISRRRAQPQPLEAAEWPSDDAFVVPRWQRGAAAPAPQARPEPPPPASPGRPLPRSTRRRADG